MRSIFKTQKSKRNFIRFAMQGSLYGLSLSVVALGLAVCMIKTPELNNVATIEMAPENITLVQAQMQDAKGLKPLPFQ